MSILEDEAAKKILDDVSEVNKTYHDLRDTVDEAIQSIEQVKLDLLRLSRLNKVSRFGSLPPCDPLKSHCLLIDNDGVIERRKIEIQTANEQLRDLQMKTVALFDEISHKYDTLYIKLESIHQKIKHFEIGPLNHSEIDPNQLKQNLAVIENTSVEFFEDFKQQKKLFGILQTEFTSFQEDINSWDHALECPEIFTIKHADLPALETYLSDQVASDRVHKFFEIYQLRKILRTKPVNDVVAIECWKQIRFAYWKLNKGAMPIYGNIWETWFGDVINQLQHEICWAIVSAELVSVIRRILGRDNPIIDYSAQYLVDFTKPHLRKQKRHSSHYCYTCDVDVALEYVRVNGIETTEARPLALLECLEYVRPKNSSNLGYIGDVVPVDTLGRTVTVVASHPVAASIPIFEPEYSALLNNMYSGPTSRISRYCSMHAVNITGTGEENGEKFVWVRTSHGENHGVQGYLKVSVEVMVM